MSDQAENLILRRLDLIHKRNNRIIEGIDRLTDEVRSLKVRTTAVEDAVVGTNRRLDRGEDRLERIERRLDLVEPVE